MEKMLSGGGQLSGLTLQALIERAVRQGADAIELEFVPEGLEVIYMCGRTGIGEVIEDREAVQALIREVVTQAKLERRSRGVIKWVHEGRTYDIRAEQYDQFGEIAFRLSLRKSRRSA